MTGSVGGTSANVTGRMAALLAENARLRAALATASLDAKAAMPATEAVQAELARAREDAGRAAAGHVRERAADHVALAGAENRAADADFAAVANGEARFHTLAEGIPGFVWRSADDGDWTWASPQWLAYTGQTQEESHGRGWLAAIHREDHEATMRAWAGARTRGRLEVEHRVRRASDGAWRWHQTRDAPLRGPPTPEEPEGCILEWVGVSTDIEDLKRLQGEQGVLLLELQHRTRNILAVVQGIALRSLPANPERRNFGARLAAMGRVQGFLARSGAWSVPLRDLVEAELRAAGDGEGTQVEGPGVDLPGEKVQPVALALHELAANAAKHGAIAQAAGHLAVTWHLEEADGGTRLVIEWREARVVMPPGPLHRGFGTELIERSLPHQLGGEVRLEHGPDGVRCRMAMPLPGDGGRGTAHSRPASLPQH